MQIELPNSGRIFNHECCTVLLAELF